ncbi:hypothetical protein KP509_30G058900 [Ceratopteris richardii]|uniref:Rieske domain-containing protein n=2 Tax=Ceratopteris richardii TaxID=49495 RepID=A0A8T2R2R6_CERRI|nr:hypothetical protein KP509_30G058900 [Ceratopteris richardii]
MDVTQCTPFRTALDCFAVTGVHKLHRRSCSFDKRSLLSSQRVRRSHGHVAAYTPFSSTGSASEIFEDEEEHQDPRISRVISVDAFEKAEYNWEEEWYPLYLANELPRDAPLGLSIFHKQVVLYYDGAGDLRCYEDRCPHRLAKLSEGQLMDGRLECLYHGWQFEGDGQCVRIPQLPAGAKIPAAACARSYTVHNSQGVIWIWMGDKKKADVKNIPHFDQFDDPTNMDISTIHVLPYDHSILLENLMDPAHIPISHDRTDLSAKRENAQALKFEIVERTPRGFCGRYGESSKDDFTFKFRFQAPCIIQNEREIQGKDGNPVRFMAIFMCTPAGQGKSMLIARFAQTGKRSLFSAIPEWLIHQVSNKVFEQDMGFLASQNEVLLREGVPTSRLYLNLKSSDVLVLEYRKWLDKVGHGMPYYIGHRSLSLPSKEALLEAAPAGFLARTASSQPVKGAFGGMFAADLTNRYFRHVVHCSKCRAAFRKLKSVQKMSAILALLSVVIPLTILDRPWRLVSVVVGSVALAALYLCEQAIKMLTTNEMRAHRKTV